MNIKIVFNKESSDKRTKKGWEWFYGTINAGKDYEFSLCEMTDKHSNTTTLITWINGTPVNSDELEVIIKEEFNKEFE